jgi:HPt (histidine-containing phosphotransfer) domain-containing protein
MIAGKYYNLEYLEEISGGDKDFIQDMLTDFITNTPNVITELNQYANEQNWNKLYYIAHKFAPSFDFVGAEQIKGNIRQLEEYAKAANNIDKIPGLINTIQLYCNDVINELKNDFKIEV